MDNYSSSNSRSRYSSPGSYSRSSRRNHSLSRSPEHHSRRKPTHSRSRSPEHFSSSYIKRKQKAILCKQYYEEKRVLDKIKTNQEEEEYNPNWKPATVGNFPVQKKKPEEKICKREKALRKDAQTLFEKEMAEWEEQDNELDAFLAAREGSNSESDDAQDEEEDNRIASKLPPLDTLVKSEPQKNNTSENGYIPYVKKKSEKSVPQPDIKPYIPYGKAAKNEPNTSESYEPYLKRSKGSCVSLSENKSYIKSVNSSNSEGKPYEPYRKRVSSSATISDYEPNKKRPLESSISMNERMGNDLNLPSETESRPSSNMSDSRLSDNDFSLMPSTSRSTSSMGQVEAIPSYEPYGKRMHKSSNDNRKDYEPYRKQSTSKSPSSTSVRRKNDLNRSAAIQSRPSSSMSFDSRLSDNEFSSLKDLADSRLTDSEGHDESQTPYEPYGKRKPAKLSSYSLYHGTAAGSSKRYDSGMCI